MNITSSTTQSAASEFSASQNISKPDTNSKVSGKSFDEEVKNASKNEAVQENKDNKETAKDVKNEKTNSTKNDDNKDKNIDKSIVPSEDLSGEISFTDFKYHNESQSLLSQNIQSLLNTKDLMGIINSASTIEYDSLNMSESDANFFADLVQNGNLSMQGIINQPELIENSANIQQNIKVSSVLMEKLSESLNTNKPFRIDFDKDVSVIIRVNKDGSLSANFIPGDKAVEQYLRNNIASLRQRFDEENLSYSELTYSNSRNGQQQRRKKENENE